MTKEVDTTAIVRIIMANIHMIIIPTLLFTLCHQAGRAEAYGQFVCTCQCVYEYVATPPPRSSPVLCPVRQSLPAPQTSEETITLNNLSCDENDYEYGIECSSIASVGGYNCSGFTDCCRVYLYPELIDPESPDYNYNYNYTDSDWNVTCSGGPSRRCRQVDCYLASAQSCTCYYEYEYYYSTNIPEGNQDSTTPISRQESTTPSHKQTTTNNEPRNEQSKRGFAIGLGVGIGISVFVAVIIALLVYCRLQGRREGQGKAQGTLPKGTLPSTKADRQGDNEEYAEMDSYVGDATLRAVANQAYSSSDVVITPGQSDQAYTSLNNPAINSHQYKSLKKPNQDLGDGEYADPEKYTEPPVLPRRNSNFIDDEDDDEDYVSQGTPEPATNNDDSRDDYTLATKAPSRDNINSSAQSNPKESPTSSSDYVSVDTQNHPNSISPSSDYVSVDTSDHPSPISPSSDYVSVDATDNDIEENDISSDYVDF